MKYLLGAAIVLTFLLINLGGLVHNTGSSLACPDWPLCYGQLMPKMEGGILIEHSHRLLASLVGFLSILLVLGFWKKKPWRNWALVALGLVLFQGVLGGLTVIYRLPTIVSTAHLALSMIFFLTLLGGFFFLTQKYSAQSSRALRMSLVTTFVLTYSQMILGAFMRHAGLGGACGTGWGNSLLCFDVITMQELIPTSSQAIIHFSHRLLGIIVGAFSFLSAYFLMKSKQLVAAIALVVLVSFQIILGVLTVGTNLDVLPTTLHLGVASLLLAVVFLSLLSNRFWEKRSEFSLFIADTLSLTKPRLSALVIVTAGLGMLMAPGNVEVIPAFLTLFSTTMIVAGACTINCYMEREGDKLMTRTKTRPLPANRLSPNYALSLGIGLMLFFLPIIAWSSNYLTAALGAIACIVYIFLYTPMKRRTSLALFAGAIPGAIPPLMGWTSVTNSIGAMGLVLFGILFVWQLPHFLSISLYRLEEYKNAGIKILPLVSSIHHTKLKIILYTFFLLLVSLFPLYLKGSSILYIIGSLALGLSFLAYSMKGFSLEGETLKVWAKKYFFGSLVYLPGILCLMLLYKG